LPFIRYADKRGSFISYAETWAIRGPAEAGNLRQYEGGFTGTDPAPTLAEFETWANEGDITYYIAGGGMGGGHGGQGTSSQITTWVESHFKSASIGGETVYLLLEPKS
jgi:hypothetical protein